MPKRYPKALDFRGKPDRSEAPVTRITCDVPAPLARALRERAARLGRSVSSLVAEALEAGLRAERRHQGKTTTGAAEQ
jgi:hypothetical protein